MSDLERPAAATTSGTSRTNDLDTEFRVFYRKTTKQLVAFLILQGAPLHDAAVIAQDTMTLAYRRWDTIDHPRAWSYRVASRALVRKLSTVHEEPVAEPLNPLLRATEVEHWEQHQDVARMLARLPGRQRQVMAWTLSEYTPAEIATELRMTPEAVRASLYQARRTLRAYLAGEEGTQ
jgi:RNA polymerase sigma factor (sigma-70 family)